MIVDSKDGRAAPATEAGAGWSLALILLVGFVVRLIHLDQPIVENYVGRQIPTAMVARQIVRGSGFLHPQLEVGPFPNAFLVEPPVYAATCALIHRVSGIPLGAAGRLVSSLGLGLAVWGLHALLVPRSGRRTALMGALLLSGFPLSLRYGRSFQPDALMLGCMVAGLACWDRGVRWDRASWLWGGVLLTATGLSLKVISAYLLVPLVVVIGAGQRRRTIALALFALAPALGWYLRALIDETSANAAGSRASADNGAIWLRVFLPTALLRGETWRHVGYFLGFRAFTPIAPVLAVAGILQAASRERRLWSAWGLATLAAMAGLAAKLHHEYYWLTLAPVVAAGSALALERFLRGPEWSRGLAGILGVGLLLGDMALSLSTWRTPDEWRALRTAGVEVRRIVGPDEWVAAPESLIYEADRRGCRIEFTAAAAQRAAREWRDHVDSAELARVSDPIDLVAFYRERGAIAFADVVPSGRALRPERVALHEAVRRRYNVVIDRDGVLIALLSAPREPDRNASRP